MISRKMVLKLGIYISTTLSALLLTTQSGYAAMYEMPPKGNDIVGEVQVVRASHGDTLLTIANRYEVGMHEMLEANPNLHLNQETATQPLHRGTKVVVPTQYVLPPFRKGIVINLPELRLYYFTPDKHYVYTFPVGLGRDEWRTPLASTSVVRKTPDPTWRVPKSIKEYVYQETGRVLPDEMPPGEENPLGPYAMYLAKSGYLIHGTNQPWSIGKYISSGCIRMQNESVDQLYHMVSVGTPVHIVNYGNKAGWLNGKLYLESQSPVQLSEAAGPLNNQPASTVVNSALKTHAGAVDWNRVSEVASNGDGLPEEVGSRPISQALNQ